MTWAIVSKPTTSLVLKVADLARPSLLPVMASTSSKPRPNFCASANTARIEKTPTRLPIKFGVSLARTTPLPIVEVIKVSSASNTAGSVSAAGMSSSKCIYRGGLKKCTPQKRFFRSPEKPLASSPIGRPEVLVANRACAGICGATFS